MPSRRRRMGGDREERRRQDEHDEPRTGSGHSPGNGPLHDNKKRLGVDEEHKTRTMRARRRGTFP